MGQAAKQKLQNTEFPSSGTDQNCTNSHLDETSVLSICEKNAHFLGWKFPLTNYARQRTLNIFNSDFGILAPTNLILLVLSYTCGNRIWNGPIESTFTAYIGQAEGACSHNPYDDTYVLKMGYYSGQPFHIFNKLTSEKISNFSSRWSCPCVDFDLEGNYYIAAYYENQICKYNKKHRLLWIKDYDGPVSVAYRRTDRLLYTVQWVNKLFVYLILKMDHRLKHLISRIKNIQVDKCIQ